MAKGISRGVIKEAIQKLGGASDDIVRSVDGIAESANMLSNPRKAFNSMIDEFGGIKYGDGFTMRRPNPYASDAPIYTGTEGRMVQRLRPEDVDVIPPSWNRSGADFQAPAIRQRGDLVYNPGTDFTMGGGSGVEYTGQNFTMGRGSDTVYTGPVKGGTGIVPVNGGVQSNTGLATRRLNNADDLARDAHINADIDSRMNAMDSANAADRARTKKEKYMKRHLYEHNRMNLDGSKMSFSERRAAKRMYHREDAMEAADKWAEMQIARENAEAGPGFFDGIGQWAKDNQLLAAGAIAGTAIVASSILDDDY